MFYSALPIKLLEFDKRFTMFYIYKKPQHFPAFHQLFIYSLKFRSHVPLYVIVDEKPSSVQETGWCRLRNRQLSKTSKTVHFDGIVIACSAPHNYFNWNRRNTFQSNLNQNTNIKIKKMHFKILFAKWQPFCRWHLKMHFLRFIIKCLYFDSNLPYWSALQYTTRQYWFM